MSIPILLLLLLYRKILCANYQKDRKEFPREKGSGVMYMLRRYCIQMGVHSALRELGTRERVYISSIVAGFFDLHDSAYTTEKRNKLCLRIVNLELYFTGLGIVSCGRYTLNFFLSR